MKNLILFSIYWLSLTAQSSFAACHPELICTPLEGCHEVTICDPASTPPTPEPPRGPNCTNVWVCNGVSVDCHWEQVCH